MTSNNKLAMYEIKFKHYRTEEVITKMVSDMPYNNDTSELLIVYNHTDDHIEAIIKKSIIK